MYAANVAASRRKLPSFSKSPKVMTLSIMIITSHLFKMNEMGATKKSYQPVTQRKWRRQTRPRIASRLSVNDKPSKSYKYYIC